MLAASNKLKLILGWFRSRALGVELHHADLAISGELDIRDLEHRSTLDGAGTRARQLHRNILRRGIQNDRRDLERRRELDGRDLETACHMD